MKTLYKFLDVGNRAEEDYYSEMSPVEVATAVALLVLTLIALIYG